MWIPRDEYRLLALILLLAAGLRIAACALWWDDLSRDPDAYAGLADRLLEGQGYAAPDGRPTAYRPPLYPLSLVAVSWAGPIGIAALHIGLGVATVLLTHALGLRLGLARWSLLAAAIVAVDPLLLRYTPQVMTEVTCAFLTVLTLWLAAADRRPLLLGLAFGLAALSRPTFWAFGALAVIAWILTGERGASAPRARPSRLVRNALLLALGATLVTTPWLIRNWIVLGSPVLTTTHGGYTLLLANNPVFWREVVTAPPGAAWQGDSLDAWQRSLESAMADSEVPPDDELARDRWLRSRALEHIRQHPSLFLRSVAYRVMRLWAIAPTASTSGRTSSSIATSAAAAFYLLVHVLALVGAVRLLGGRGSRRAANAPSTSPTQAVAAREEPPSAPPRPLPPPPASWLPSLLLILSFTAVHALYWTDARMRAPLVPAVALLAAGALTGRRLWCRLPVCTRAAKPDPGRAGGLA